jgi:hypothetical protein
VALCSKYPRPLTVENFATGHSKERTHAALPQLRALLEPAKGVDDVPAGEQGADANLPEAHQGPEQGKAHRRLSLLKSLYLIICDFLIFNSPIN